MGLSCLSRKFTRFKRRPELSGYELNGSDGIVIGSIRKKIYDVLFQKEGNKSKLVSVDNSS